MHETAKDVFGVKFLAHDVARGRRALADRIVGKGLPEFISAMDPLPESFHFAAVLCSKEIWQFRTHRQVGRPGKRAERSCDRRNRYFPRFWS
jgi:hypothetical protein